ncbi:LysR family transcriptional regulator [Neobacillus bataviensis LMG 21833]|uniref:LysR family transcriptional regulator n=1 Tax=Neobacillus bataviensis LMG 21833 TaxID=1117379 RepID=K6DZW5_9BACI|nr:LysR family transcriptional regulator [Neobacillus bataviensis]EKN66441.1 LysR family transcriptional regulator [Neobacillus bataviensis LMG 21833]
MNIQNLEAFVYVVQFGSFNKAAEALFLSQPSISARIRSLENELNTVLLNREGRKSFLTDAGKNFLPHAEKILNQYQEALYKINQQIYIPDQIRIACANSVSSYIIPEILPQLLERFPYLNVKITSSHSEEVIPKVLNNEVDFGIIREIIHPKINSITILDSHVGLYASPDHTIFNGNNPVSIEELANHKIIFYDHNSPDWLLISRLLEPINFHQKMIVFTDNMEAAKRLVKKNLGICFLPEHAVQEELANGTLAQVPLKMFAEVSTRITLIHLIEKEPSPIVNFIQSIFI